jgi:hypothetical protein
VGARGRGDPDATRLAVAGWRAFWDERADEAEGPDLATAPFTHSGHMSVTKLQAKDGRHRCRMMVISRSSQRSAF